MFTKVTNPRACIHSIPFTTIYKKTHAAFLPPSLSDRFPVRLHRARAEEKNKNKRTMCRMVVYQTTQHVKSKQERI